MIKKELKKDQKLVKKTINNNIFGNLKYKGHHYHPNYKNGKGINKKPSIKENTINKNNIAKNSITKNNFYNTINKTSKK